MGDKQPWMVHLYEEFLFCEKGTVEHDVASVIQDMLLSSGSADDAPRTAAYKLDSYYWDRNLDSGPLFLYQKDDDGVPSPLSVIYAVVIKVALFLPYNDAKQDLLVQLVVELQGIPPKPVKAWNADRLVPLGEPMFVEMLEDAWRRTFVTDTREEAVSPFQFKEECEKWVNLSAFLARCTAARLDDHIRDTVRYPIRYPCMDIPEGLEKDIPPGTKRDARVMVAAQHILLAGNVLNEELFQKQEDNSWGLSKWQVWVKRLDALSKDEIAPDTKAAVVEARKKLVSFHPELFSVS